MVVAAKAAVAETAGVTRLQDGFRCRRAPFSLFPPSDLSSRNSLAAAS